VSVYHKLLTACEDLVVKIDEFITLGLMQVNARVLKLNEKKLRNCALIFVPFTCVQCIGLLESLKG
jgi:hypothetical protein